MKKVKVATILGTRPEIIRLSEIIKKADTVFEHYLVHTGQNYDYELNEIFFDNFGIRKPDIFLNVLADNLGAQIGNIISKSYEVLSTIRPDAVLVLGDTNSSLCTIAAKRLKIPIFHMEAGNRCFDQNVPEEINRKIVDHISDINLPYTENSRRNLLREGIKSDHIFVTGSPLFEVYTRNYDSINRSKVLNKLNLSTQKYIVVSIHREENVDNDQNFKSICDSLNAIVSHYQYPIIFSTHPRTKKKIQEQQIKFNPLIQNIPPLGYFDYVKLQKNAFVVLSDSGTISEESAIYQFPAISIRTSTERQEALDAGTILLGGITSAEILDAINILYMTLNKEAQSVPPEYKVLDVSSKVIRLIKSYFPIINQVVWNKSYK